MRRSHQQGCRYTLATHITDAEEQFVIADEVVIKVTTDTLGGFQIPVEVDIAALWESVRYHRHLQSSGHVQLVFEGCLLGCLFLQVPHILFERALHGCKRVAQLAYLILVPDIRQGGIEVSLGHLVGGIGQSIQGTYHLTDIRTAEEIDNHHTDYRDDQQYTDQGECWKPEGSLGNDNGHRPVGRPQWCIIHVRP